jgi:hypothetical protein
MTELSNQTKEITIVKKKVTMQSEEYFSIGLKSPDETIESLLQKAMSVLTTDEESKIKQSLELI